MAEEERMRGPRGQGDSGGEDYEERGRGPRGRGRPMRRIRQCIACTEGEKVLNYKQADVLRRYVTDRGKIKPRRQTGLCARHQRVLATSVKRARHLALLPYVGDRGPR